MQSCISFGVSLIFVGRSCISLGQQATWSPNFFLSDTVVHTSNLPGNSTYFMKWLGADQDIMPAIHEKSFRRALRNTNSLTSFRKVEFQESSSPDQRPWSRLCLSRGNQPGKKISCRCVAFFWRGVVWKLANLLRQNLCCQMSGSIVFW